MNDGGEAGGTAAAGGPFEADRLRRILAFYRDAGVEVAVDESPRDWSRQPVTATASAAARPPVSAAAGAPASVPARAPHGAAPRSQARPAGPAGPASGGPAPARPAA
ncbi:hypothetical protein ACFOGJ_00480, partial [Marinibaculum pumilum]